MSENETVKDLVKMVMTCRKAQIAYFKMVTKDLVTATRSQISEALKAAKKSERILDEWLELYNTEVENWAVWEAGEPKQAQESFLDIAPEAKPT